MSKFVRYCPSCGADWQGAEIPEAHRDNFGGKSHYQRVIGIVDQDLDRLTGWRCPDCRTDFAVGDAALSEKER